MDYTKLKTIREALGLTLVEEAAILKNVYGLHSISTGFLNNIENGHSEPVGKINKVALEQFINDHIKKAEKILTLRDKDVPKTK